MRHHPHPYEHIVISKDVYDKLTRASVDTCFAKETWEIAEEAVDEWTRRHHPNALPMPATSGYQWKSLFLPNGTVLRTIFGGKNHHCLVEADQVLYQGAATSPSGFVNAVGGVRRNAWRCTWILFPDTLEWKLADTLRTRASSPQATLPKPAPSSAPSPAPTPPQAAATSTRGERRADAGPSMADLLLQQLLPILSRLCTCQQPSSLARFGGTPGHAAARFMQSHRPDPRDRSGRTCTHDR